MTFETDDIVDTGATENTATEVETEQTGVASEATQEPEIEKTPEQIQEEQAKQEKTSRYTRRVKEALARANAAEQRAAELEARLNTPSQSTEPQLEDFDDYSEWQKALSAHQRAEVKRELLAELDGRDAQKNQSQKQAELQSAMAELEDEGVDVEGLSVKAESLPPLPIQLDQFGLSSKETLKLAAKLLDDDDLYFELSQMNPVQAAAKIGRMIDLGDQKPKPKVSKAPPPIKPVQANAPASRSVDSLSDEEFLAQRRKNRLKG